MIDCLHPPQGKRATRWLPPLRRKKHVAPLAYTVFVATFVSVFSAGQESRPTTPGPIRPTDLEVPIPHIIDDPFERVNRGFERVNYGLMKGVIQPTSYAYRFVIRKPVRRWIENAGHNIAYPGRLVNNLFQGKWSGAGIETKRFLINSTVGVAGLFDVASKWNVYKSNEDFGQTFGEWGWNPLFALHVPVQGPKSDRDGLGAILDTAANPSTYFFPAPLVFNYNRLADRIFDYTSFVSAHQDPYSLMRDVWALQRESMIREFEFEEADTPATQTLRAMFFGLKDLDFPRRAEVRTIRIPSTGKELPYHYWRQRSPASLVFVLPGLADHARANNAMAMAELAYNRGNSVVLISSTFNFEFIQSASSVPLPGYADQDVRDLYTALDLIYQDLSVHRPQRVASRTLLGISFGGFQTLYLAGHPDIQSGQLLFDRYLAVHPPVDLLYAVEQLDAFYNAPLAWLSETNVTKVGSDSMDQLRERLQATLIKGVRLAQGTIAPSDPVPYSDIEAKYIIGTAFRIALRDAIFVSQARTNLGVLKTPISRWDRREVYREILEFSYSEYLTEFLLPYYRQVESFSQLENPLVDASALKEVTEQLENNEAVFLVSAENDFLLSEEDLDWIESTFGPSRARLFPTGGHLGNLYRTEVREAIESALPSRDSTVRTARRGFVPSKYSGIDAPPLAARHPPR